MKVVNLKEWEKKRIIEKTDKIILFFKQKQMN